MKRLPVLSLVLAVAVVAAAAVVYRAAADTYFYNDDFQWLLAARAFRLVAWLNPWAHDHFFRPLAELYFYVARLAWDRSAPAYHLASIALHTVNALLVWRVATLISRRRVLAVAGLCFVVQPGAVEAVAWVCSISTVLAATGCLLAIWFHVRHLDTRQSRWAWLAVASFVLSLASHESAVMLLPLLYGVECVRAEHIVKPWAREGHGLAGTRYLPYATVLAVYLAAAYVVNARNYVVTEG